LLYETKMHTLVHQNSNAGSKNLRLVRSEEQRHLVGKLVHNTVSRRKRDATEVVLNNAGVEGKLERDRRKVLSIWAGSRNPLLCRRGSILLWTLDEWVRTCPRMPL